MKKMKTEIKRNVNNRSLLVAKEEDLIKNLNPKIIVSSRKIKFLSPAQKQRIIISVP